MSGQRNDRPGAPELLERPLTARSVVLSLLLGRRPAQARVALLVRWCDLFGITENAVRVALSRMVERGELSAEDGRYELAGPLRRRQQEQETALTPPVAGWDGQWHVLLVTSTGRDAGERAARRDALRRAHFAEMREGVWVRPGNEPLPTDEVVRSHTATWTGRPPEGETAAVVETLFGVRQWAHRATALRRELERVTAGLTTETLAHAFVVGAAALQHLRRDPRLPASLLAPGWPGAGLRDGYSRYREAFSAAVAAWYRSA